MQSLSALLLSNDAAAVRMSNKILGDYSFQIKSATSAATACDLLQRNRFHLAILDEAIPGSIDLASQASATVPRIVFAIVGGPKSNIGGKRIHFTLQKPLTADLFSRSVRAAYGVMLREMRAAYRHKVCIHAETAAVMCAGREQKVERVLIHDLSQTGLCLSAEGALLPQGAAVQIGFRLPATQDVLNITGAVIWAHGSGRAGVKFIRVPREDRVKLQTWFDAELRREGALISVGEA
jgi:response regulator RpfG family c-di-GMP phosphodiesterase